MARKETRQSLEEFHHQEVGRHVSIRLHASYKSAEEALTSLDVPHHFVTLACRIGMYDEAKQWASLALKHGLAVLRAREENGSLSAGPEDDQAGFSAYFCAAAPVLWSFARRERPSGDDLRIMRVGLELCARIAEASVEELAAMAPKARAEARPGNIAASKVFSGFFTPAVAINAGAMVHKGQRLHLELKRLLKDGPKGGGRAGTSPPVFPLEDAVFTALLGGKAAAFGEALAEIWRATDLNERPYNFHLQLKLISLWMAAEKHWKKPVVVEVDPPMKGFGYRAYWGED